MQNISAIAESFDANGFVIVSGFVSAKIRAEVETRILELVEDHAAGQPIGDALLVEEASQGPPCVRVVVAIPLSIDEQQAIAKPLVALEAKIEIAGKSLDP